jgi:hypothetical protein
VGAQAKHAVRDEKKICVAGERVLHAQAFARKDYGKLSDLIDPWRARPAMIASGSPAIATQRT